MSRVLKNIIANYALHGVHFILALWFVPLILDGAGASGYALFVLGGVLLGYFGIDWIAMVFTFVAIYLLGNKSRVGFLTMMCGNACWVGVGILTSSAAMVIANAVFFAMNARGWHRWSQDSPGAT